MEKKVRFGDLVRNSGRPQVLTLWTKPEDNPALAKARKENRVLTVIQEPGKTDYGLVGFELRRGALYLIFPRLLPPTQDVKVIGINFQLVEQPDFAPAEQPRASATARSEEARPEHKPEPPKPPTPKVTTRAFKVSVRRTASIDSEFTVEAKNKEEAKRQAVEEAKKAPFDLSEAKVEVEVVRAK
jgi:hypothetical protein